MNTFSKALQGPFPGFFASKWIKIAFFPSYEELLHLFDSLPFFGMYPLGTYVKDDDCEIEKNAFCDQYGKILEDLFAGKEISPTKACAMTTDTKDLYQISFQDRSVLKIKSPVIQVNVHYFRYSPVDSAFRSNVFSEDKIFWGLQFAFPMIFQDENRKLHNTKDFPNFRLFRDFRKWIRSYTLPMPFLVHGKKVTTTMRIGKKLFPKIDQHPDLLQQNIVPTSYQKDVHAH